MLTDYYIQINFTYYQKIICYQISRRDYTRVYKEHCETKWKAERFLLKISIWLMLIGIFTTLCVKAKRYRISICKRPIICVILTAIIQNGLVSEYVKDQSHELCLKTVKQNIYALQYVKD